MTTTIETVAGRCSRRGFHHRGPYFLPARASKCHVSSNRTLSRTKVCPRTEHAQGCALTPLSGLHGRAPGGTGQRRASRTSQHVRDTVPPISVGAATMRMHAPAQHAPAHAPSTSLWARKPRSLLQRSFGKTAKVYVPRKDVCVSHGQVQNPSTRSLWSIH